MCQLTLVSGKPGDALAYYKMLAIELAMINNPLDGNHIHGVGITDFDTILKSKEPGYDFPIDTQKIDFTRQNILLHVRKATVGDIDDANAHPFIVEYGGVRLIGAHNGSFRFDEVEIRKNKELLDFLGEPPSSGITYYHNGAIKTKESDLTDSEYFYRLFAYIANKRASSKFKPKTIASIFKEASSYFYRYSSKFALIFEINGQLYIIKERQKSLHYTTAKIGDEYILIVNTQLNSLLRLAANLSYVSYSIVGTEYDITFSEIDKLDEGIYKIYFNKHWKPIIQKVADLEFNAKTYVYQSSSPGWRGNTGKKNASANIVSRDRNNLNVRIEPSSGQLNFDNIVRHFLSVILYNMGGGIITSYRRREHVMDDICNVINGQSNGVIAGHIRALLEYEEQIDGSVFDIISGVLFDQFNSEQFGKLFSSCNIIYPPFNLTAKSILMSLALGYYENKDDAFEDIARAFAYSALAPSVFFYKNIKTKTGRQPNRDAVRAMVSDAASRARNLLALAINTEIRKLMEANIIENTPLKDMNAPLSKVFSSQDLQNEIVEGIVGNNGDLRRLYSNLASLSVHNEALSLEFNDVDIVAIYNRFITSCLVGDC